MNMTVLNRYSHEVNDYMETETTETVRANYEIANGEIEKGMPYFSLYHESIMPAS
jgi:hypothetical protein